MSSIGLAERLKEFIENDMWNTYVIIAVILLAAELVYFRVADKCSKRPNLGPGLIWLR